MKKYLFSIFSILFFLNGSGQDVNSITIIPTNPDNTDLIKAIVNTSMNTSDCWINTSSVTTTGNNHAIIGAHCSGIAQQVCTKSDTYSLGILPVGNHVVSYDMFYGNLSTGQTQCSSYIFGDSLSTSFTVTNSGGNLPVELHPQGSHNICQGDSFYLESDVFGQANYKWFLNGNLINTGNQHYIWAKDSGYYQVRQLINGDSGTSMPVLINAFSAPTDILTQSGNTLFSDYNSSTYQWFKLGAGQIVGADSNQYLVTENGEYFVQLISAEGCIGYSDILYVELIDACIEPTDSTFACASDSIVLSANPSGSQYTYQWFRDGFALSGAIQSTFTPFLSGEYVVRIAVSQSVDTSAIHGATLYPGPTPSITFDGANLFVTPAVSYQWYKSGSGKINGATDSLYTPTETGLYIAEVEDSFGCFGKSNGYAITVVGMDEQSKVEFNAILIDEWIHITQNEVTNSSFSIIDLTGQLVYTGELNGLETFVNVSQWASGLYFIHCNLKTGKSQKLIIH